MQEEIIAKFTWLGKKLGIVDKDEDDEAEELANKEEKEKKEKLANNENNKNQSKDKSGRPSSTKKPNYVADSPTNKDLSPKDYSESPAPGYNSSLGDDYSSAKLRSPHTQNPVAQQK